jgi:nucleotide-binding universal stress UspA family protein
VDAIDVLHVIPVPSRMRYSEAMRADEVQRVRPELAELLATVNAGVRWNLTVELGDPRSVILAEATRHDADLVALGTKGRTGLARVLVGSVAESVIRGATSDVLVARLPEVHR